MSIQFEYFYGSQAEQFSFYRIPKVLFTDETLSGISVEAKVLYSFMLDRMSLSVKNCWFDEENRVYIIYTIDDILSDFGCARQKALPSPYSVGCSLILFSIRFEIVTDNSSGLG